MEGITLTHGSLFSGIGGFDLAAEWMGWNNVFHCEWNEFGKKILKYYWPNAISYDDITKTDFTIHRGQIDILTGGFPCQGFSTAGKRLGTEDDRWLWPEMLRAIREIQPVYVVGENVRGLINWNGGLVFDQVQADLEAEGYEVLPFLLPACGVNAPHRRDRIWFIAYRDNKERDWGSSTSERTRQKTEQWRDGIRRTTSRFGEIGTTTNSGSIDRNIPIQQRGQNEAENIDIARKNEGRIIADTNSRGLAREKHGQKKSGFFTETGSRNDWQNFPTQSPVCSRNDGVSSGLSGITFSKHRNESIKAHGNAIVPQIAYKLFNVIAKLLP